MAFGRPETNELFHAGYDRACARAEDATPIFVVLAETLVVFRGGEKRRERTLTVPAFHAIKTAAHAPVAVFAIASPRADRSLDATAAKALAKLRGARAPGPEGVAPEAARDIGLALEYARTYADRLLQEEAVSGRGLAEFAARCGPVLLRLTEHATRVQLASLHTVVEEELCALGVAERRKLHVVVTGDHQARVRSLGMQYFQKRLAEKPGAEERVTYAEGVEDAEEAMALVGKCRFDRAIAGAFFGDPSRLQRDVLGDAAASLLGRFRAEVIGAGE